MQIKEVMTPNFKMITADSPIRLAAEAMRDLNIGVLPVEKNQKIIGMVTDRDIVVRGVAAGKDCSNIPIAEVMTGKILHCNQDDDPQTAIELMEKHQVRRLIVVDEQNSPVGILSLGDLAVKCPGHEKQGEALEHISR